MGIAESHCFVVVFCDKQDRQFVARTLSQSIVLYIQSASSLPVVASSQALPDPLLRKKEEKESLEDFDHVVGHGWKWSGMLSCRNLVK